ncbi:MAG: alpha/beta fold hydrolase [Actinophytocola sp.]|nr:alpha/beta fold hydrolase [Actinophytocola sp.]
MRRAVLAVLMLALLGGFATPAAAAPSSGYNDWSCHPSAAHPRPVVLIHGLGGNGQGNWAYHGPRLADAGYCTFSFTYGQQFPGAPGGTRPVKESAQEVGAFIDEVLAATGADRADLVGHSEGGFLSLYVPKVAGYAPRVGTVVALAPPTHGTTVSGLVTVGQLLGGQEFIDLLTEGVMCYACGDLVVGGEAVAELTDGPIAQQGVDYTIIATRYDTIVTPTSTSFVDEAGVDNQYVQDSCASDPVGHVGIAFDPTVTQLLTNALDPSTAVDVRCGFGPPF